MINIDIKPTENSLFADVIIEGDVALRSVANILPPLSAAVDKYEKLNVKFQNMTSFDLSGIQVIFALQKSAEEKSKEINITGDIDADMQQLLINNGLEKIFQ